jgi:hypothetical protein
VAFFSPSLLQFIERADSALIQPHLSPIISQLETLLEGDLNNLDFLVVILQVTQLLSRKYRQLFRPHFQVCFFFLFFFSPSNTL